jgi:Family of unknown function (DUF5681)
MTLQEELMAKPPCRDGRPNNRPPVSGQFPPGKSPNPSGRPPGGRSRKTIVLAAFNAKVSFVQNGKRVRVTKFGMIQLANKFALGDMKAFLNAHVVLQQYGLMEQETTAFLAQLSERDDPVMDDIVRRIRESAPPPNSENDEAAEITKPAPQTKDKS